MESTSTGSEPPVTATTAAKDNNSFDQGQKDNPVTTTTTPIVYHNHPAIGEPKKFHIYPRKKPKDSAVHCSFNHHHGLCTLIILPLPDEYLCRYQRLEEIYKTPPFLSSPIYKPVDQSAQVLPMEQQQQESLRLIASASSKQEITAVPGDAETNIKTARVVLLGAGGVGKSSLIQVIRNRTPIEFNSVYFQTEGVDFLNVKRTFVSNHDRRFEINFWDTAGEDHTLHPHPPSFYRNVCESASAVVLVISATAPDSMQYAINILFDLDQSPEIKPFRVFVYLNKWGEDALGTGILQNRFSLRTNSHASMKLHLQHKITPRDVINEFKLQFARASKFTNIHFFAGSLCSTHPAAIKMVDTLYGMFEQDWLNEEYALQKTLRELAEDDEEHAEDLLRAEIEKTRREKEKLLLENAIIATRVTTTASSSTASFTELDERVPGGGVRIHITPAASPTKKKKRCVLV